MSLTDSQIEDVLSEGAIRLLARATNSRSLSIEIVIPKLREAVRKNLTGVESVRKNLTGVESATQVNEFLDDLHADDLCLAIACERGDEDARQDLRREYGPLVRTSARRAAGNTEAAEDITRSIWSELYRFP